MLRQDMRILRADLASTAFGKNTAVYGHIDENGPSVRKWTALKMAITDKMGKNNRLSVNLGWIGWAALYLKMPDKSSRL